MPTYRAYLLDRQGHIVRGEWINAEADAEALQHAHALCSEDKPAVEVWQGRRLVAEVPCVLGDR